MIVYHVIGITDFLTCLNQGYLPAPVRAWENVTEAERFSKQTGRALILRLKFPEEAEKLFGHKNMARVLYNHYPLSIPLNGFNYKVWDAKIKGSKKSRILVPLGQ
jgi:hypothetical protein